MALRRGFWVVSGAVGLLLSVSFPGLAQSRPATKPTVLVFPFAALGDDGARATADMLRRNLINAVAAMDEVDALDPEKAEKVLGRPLVDARDACAEDALCTSALGRAVGARYIVRGGLLVKDGGYTLSVQLFDVDAGRITKGPQSQVVETADGAVGSMRAAAQWLFGTSGALAIRASVDGADVWVDSKPIGKTPLPKALVVPVGKIHVRVERAGFEPFAKTVEIRAGERELVDATLKPKPRPIAGVTPRPTPPKPLVKRPWFWAAVGGAAVAIGAGAALAASGGGGGTDVRDGEPAGQSTTIVGW